MITLAPIEQPFRFSPTPHKVVVIIEGKMRYVHSQWTYIKAAERRVEALKQFKGVDAVYERD